MTIATTSNKVVGQGNGATTNWPFSFIIPDAASLVAIYTDANGSLTVLAASQYSVAGIASSSGGSVTYPLSGSPIALGTSLTVLRTVAYNQQRGIANQGGFFPDVYEAALDYLTMQTQQLSEITSRCAQIASSITGVTMTLPTPLAGSAIGWNSTATGLANITTLAGSVALPLGINQGGTGQTAKDKALAALGVVSLTGAAGTANAQTAAAPSSYTAFTANDLFEYTPNITNTASAALTITPAGGAALAAKTFKKLTSGGRVTLVANDLIAGNSYLLLFDGTDLIVTGARVHAHGADIAAAATINLDTATGDCVDITGNTGITAITLAEGELRTTRFTGTPAITNGASLVLLGGASQTMAAGDFATWRGYAAGVVRQVSWSKASGGIVTAATQAQQEAGTTNDVAVTPGRQQLHPSALKGWAMAGVSGSAVASYNLTSVTDGGTGDISFNWAVSMSSTNYWATAQCRQTFGGSAANTLVSGVITTSFAAGVTRAQSARCSDGAITDPEAWFCAIAGDFP